MKSVLSTLIVLSVSMLSGAPKGLAQDDEMKSVPVKAEIKGVQPMTGIVLWESNEDVETAPIQLEYSYFRYDQVVTEKGRYDWTAVDELLDRVARRKHQAIIRWHDTYVARPTGVPAYIKSLGDYREQTAMSEKKPTGFPDWSHPELQAFVLEFFDEFAKRYDEDPRIAFVQVGFGLWAEYHIYDGPMELGRTFPSRAYQETFLKHLGKTFRQTPWMLSVDAAGDQTPIATSADLLAIPFGVFDDSFNHKRHEKENEPNWNQLRRERWKVAPTGGEFSFFQRVDQKRALAPTGPHGISFEEQAANFHVSFMIGDAQPRFQSSERIRQAAMATGYRFRVKQWLANAASAQVVIENGGIAPIYFDAYPAIDGVRSETSLRLLLPGEERAFAISKGGAGAKLTIESDRLVPGQSIEYEAAIP